MQKRRVVWGHRLRAAIASMPFGSVIVFYKAHLSYLLSKVFMRDRIAIDWTREWRRQAREHHGKQPDYDYVADGIVRCLRVERGDRILEVGCGEGSLSREFSKRQFTVTGLDLAPALLRNCERSMNVVVGDASKLPFRDGEFDYAVLYSVIHYLRDCEMLKETLAEAERVCSRGIFVGHIPSWREQYWGALRVKESYFVARGFSISATRGISMNTPFGKSRYDAWKKKQAANEYQDR